MENQAGSDRTTLTIQTPHPHDVLCTRTRGATTHEGNRAFRFLVQEHQVDYNVTDSKKKKNMIAKTIIARVHSLSPPGRFLVKNDGEGADWVEANEKAAMNKVTRALRDGGSKIREKATSQVLEQPTGTTELDAKQIKKEAERVVSSINSSYRYEKTSIRDGGSNSAIITENIAWSVSFPVAETHKTSVSTNSEQDSSDVSSVSVGEGEAKEAHCAVATSPSRYNYSERYKSVSTGSPSSKPEVSSVSNRTLKSAYTDSTKATAKAAQREENNKHSVSPDYDVDDFDVSSLKIENNYLDSRKVKASPTTRHQKSDEEASASTNNTSTSALHIQYKSDNSTMKSIKNAEVSESASSARSSDGSPFETEIAQNTTEVVHVEKKSPPSQYLAESEEEEVILKDILSDIGEGESGSVLLNASHQSNEAAAQNIGACDTSVQSDDSNDSFESPEFFQKLERAVDNLPDYTSQVAAAHSSDDKGGEPIDFFQQLEKAVDNLPDWTGETAIAASAGGNTEATEDTTEPYQAPKRRILGRSDATNSADGSSYSRVPYIPEQIQPVMEFFFPISFVVFGYLRGHSRNGLLFFSFLFFIHTIVLSLTVFGPNTGAYRLRWAFITPKWHACFDFAMNVSYCVVIHMWPNHFGIADDIEGVSRFVAIIAFMTILNIALSYTTIKHYASIQKKKLV